jgi:hypothetical protein
MTTIGPPLYDRRALVIVEGDGARLEIPCGRDGFRVSFRAKLTARRSDNELTLELFNLSSADRAAFKKGAVVTLQAGYKDLIGTVFKGDVLHGATRRVGPDLVTTVDVQDGAARRSSATISQSFKPGSDVQAQAAALLRAAGGDQGFKAQIKEKIAGAKAEGKSVFGLVEDELAALVAPRGLEVSSQAGTLQLTVKGRPTDDPAIVLSASTGLAGAPTPIEDKGRAKIPAQLQPGFFPRRAVQLDAAGFEDEDVVKSGFYVVDVVDIQGDTHAGPWMATLDTTPLEA